MPVEFLTDEQAEAYGKFAEEPTRPELERFFFLDDEDRKLIAKRRGDHSRLGFALQMCTVRYIGLFLEDPLDVPWPVVEYLAEQLGIEDVSQIKRYTERKPTPYEHAWEIRDAYGYHPYEDHGQGFAAANAALIEAQAKVPIVQFWGKGLLASVDGLRFVVHVHLVAGQRLQRPVPAGQLGAVAEAVRGYPQSESSANLAGARAGRSAPRPGPWSA